MRGPKPEPAAVKKAKGNPSRRPLGEDPAAEAVPGIDLHHAKVQPPEWLKGNGRKLWNQLAPGCIAMKLLTAIDAGAFARYCQSYARWLDMQRRINRQGLTVHIKSNHGEWDRPHPLLGPADRLEVRLQAFEDRFGLNPAERQRLFAARAALPVGDLFGNQGGGKPAGEGAPGQDRGASTRSPVGLLN